LYPTKEFNDRILQHGSCPKCDAWIVELIEQRYDGKRFVTRATKSKALKLYNRYVSEINKSASPKKIKQGNKSNMAWKYGVTVPIKNGYNVYSVDFNGTREKI
jgi:hypothetical protein